MPKTLIVPVDGSEESERALACAGELVARLAACDVVLASVDVDDGERRREYVEGLAARTSIPSLRTACLTGDPAGTIVRAAHQEPDAAICMTTHGRGRLTAPLLGSVATEVVRGAEVPVVLVGPHCARSWWHDPARLVACWTGSGSDPILGPAEAWSTALDMELQVLCVFHPLDVKASTEPRAEFDPAIAQLDTAHADVATVALHDDFPAGAIADYARGLPATLLGLTTRARTGIGRAVLGSVAMEVVHHSPCPVLVVRGRS